MRDRRATLRNWAFGFLVFSTFGVLDFGYRYLDALSRNRPHEVGIRLLEQLTGAYTAGLLFPFTLWVARRFSFLKVRWHRALLPHVAGMAAFALLHTTLMDVTRRALAPLFGLGPYDYGIMAWRYPMEASRQVTVYVTWVVAITLFDHYRQARRNELIAAELRTKLAEAQLQNMRLQLHPHFLFNTLNTISSVMYEDVERADTMITRLSDLLRRTLRPAESQEVPLDEELTLLDLYLSLMRARFGDDLSVVYDVGTGTREAILPQLILQPLVENSIRHGSNPVTHRVDITISARRDNGQLLLEVSDRGPGMGEATTKGIGLSNTAGRLASIYNDAHSFVLANREGGGLRATLRLPYRTAAGT
jgi:signal transduction histidine kinase